jgi:uncharacterized repeat protein (TIGR03803 family)
MKKNLISRFGHALLLIASLIALSGCGGGSASPKYTVGGSVTGLATGATVALLNNNNDATTISTNGSFVFATSLPSGSRYSVTVSTQPTGQTCSIDAGSGTIGTSNVTNIAVSCTNNTYTVGGTIQGLSVSGLVLANGSDTLKVSASATSFTMPTSVTNGTAYNVTVQVNPAALNCTVISGAGKVSDADVTSISVNCSAGTESLLYSFSGGTTDGANPYSTLIQASDGNFYGTTINGGTSSDGTVFEITPGGAETVLYSFQGGAADGAHPYSKLIQANDGNFYGMTAGGGASGVGTIFKITPSGTETVLHSFAGNPTDGAYPSGSLLQASDGNFYGMTAQGGSSNTNLVGYGVVFKITPGGTETVLHSFGGPPSDGSSPAGALIQASDGNLYGLTPYGGSSNGGAVFKITPSGILTNLYFFQGGTTDGIIPYGNLIQASDGNFYGTTSQGGGAADGGVVFKITPGGAETVLYSFQGGLYSSQATTDAGNPWGSLIQASDGNLYGLTQYGGAKDDGAIFRITTSGTEVVLYSFQGAPTDSINPYDSLIQATDGDFYGMTYSGGASNLGAVFKFN